MSHRSPQLLFTCASDARLRCFNLISMQLLFVMPRLPPVGCYSSGMEVTDLQWSRTSRILMLAETSGRLALWEGSAEMIYLRDVISPR